MTRLAIRRVGNLPSDTTSFVGRRNASAQVKRKLSESRLVTLTGVAGVGKTRLAGHVGGESRRAFRDGVWLVELAKLPDPALLGHTVASTLGLQETPIRDPLAALTEYLEDKQILLILDNCEHLLDSCANLVATLLPSAPEIRVLATSREPLHVVGEHVWSLAPLTTVQ